MTKEMQPEALRLAHMLELLSMDGSMGHEIAIGRQWCSDAAAELRRLHAENEEMRETLQFVERWAVHHGSKPSCTPAEALSCIQHYPTIRAITDTYADGKRPETFDPYARIAELEAQRKPLTDEQIDAAIYAASKAGKLSWLGFKKDENGAYTVPALSPSDYQAARAIERAHGIGEVA